MNALSGEFLSVLRGLEHTIRTPRKIALERGVSGFPDLFDASRVLDAIFACRLFHNEQN